MFCGRALLLILLCGACAQPRAGSQLPGQDARSDVTRDVGLGGGGSGGVPVGAGGSPSDSGIPPAGMVGEAGATTPVQGGPVDAQVTPAPDVSGPPDVSRPVDAAQPLPDAPVTVEPVPPPPTEPGSLFGRFEAGFLVSELKVGRDGSIYAARALADGVNLTRFSAQGQQIWDVRVATAAELYPVAMDVASDGSVGVGGWFNGRLDLGGQQRTSQGDADAWASLHGPDGKMQAVTSFGAARYDAVHAVAADASGDWFLSGVMYGGSLAGTTIDGGFLARLSPTGTARWAANEGGEAVLPVGGSVIVGGFNSAQIVRVRGTNGAREWAASFGSAGVRALLADPASGRVMAFGTFGPDIVFPDRTVMARGQDDLFVTGLDLSTGRVLWGQHLLGSKGDEDGDPACLHPNGFVYFGGSHEGRNPPRLGDEEGDEHAFVAKYSFDGQQQWLKTFDFRAVEGMACDSRILLTDGTSIMQMVP